MMLNQRLVHLENAAADPVMSNSFCFVDLETEHMSLYLLDTRSATRLHPGSSPTTNGGADLQTRLKRRCRY